jgi:hypothetical protein
MTPARIEANRRNSKKSTGPRTARGKGQSRLNSLRNGGRSALCEDLLLTLLDAPPCSVDQVARAVLTPEQAAHPWFAGAVDMFRQAEIEVAERAHCLERFDLRKKNSLKREQSLNVIENTGRGFSVSLNLDENKMVR